MSEREKKVVVVSYEGLNPIKETHRPQRRLSTRVLARSEVVLSVPRHDLTSVGCQEGGNDTVCEGKNEAETRAGTVTIAPAITKMRE